MRHVEIQLIVTSRSKGNGAEVTVSLSSCRGGGATRLQMTCNGQQRVLMELKDKATEAASLDRCMMNDADVRNYPCSRFPVSTIYSQI